MTTKAQRAEVIDGLRLQTVSGGLTANQLIFLSRERWCAAHLWGSEESPASWSGRLRTWMSHERGAAALAR